MKFTDTFILHVPDTSHVAKLLSLCSVEAGAYPGFYLGAGGSEHPNIGTFGPIQKSFTEAHYSYLHVYARH